MDVRWTLLEVKKGLKLVKSIKKSLALRKISLKAFTLLECMLALVILSGAILVYQGMTKSLFFNMSYLVENDQDKWLLFSQQLRAELTGARFEKVENNKLYVAKEGKQIAFGLSKQGDFRKTATNGHGYHPMLLDLKDAKISHHNKEITVSITWKSGLERVFLYAF
ncbi:competence type IV pilus minor pilin ComGF [Streptococcus iniae]|uniref:competence type IV pilus minor pilin ComGF n=2 Tax=Streptococcus iniae TaxID=1346 RepID=UPI00374E0F44